MIAAAVRERWHAPYEIFDPHLDVGGTLGGLDGPRGTELRATFYIGASLDVGIPTAWYALQSQVLVTVGYRYVPLQTHAAPAHLLLVGLGFRAGL
jgi:hypothetical protein